MTETQPAQSERAGVNAAIGEIVFRRLHAEDEPYVREMLFADPQHFINAGEMVEYIENPEWLPAWIAGKNDADVNLPHSKFGVWIVGEMVGCVGYRLPGIRTADIWYLVSGKHARKGYATASVNMLKTILFGMGIETLRAYIMPDNEASKRTAEKTGFIQKGVWHQHLRYVAYRVS